MSELASGIGDRHDQEEKLRFLPLRTARKESIDLQWATVDVVESRSAVKTSIGLTRRRNYRGFFVCGNDSPEESIQVYEDVAALVNVRHRDGLSCFLQNTLFLISFFSLLSIYLKWNFKNPLNKDEVNKELDNG